MSSNEFRILFWSQNSLSIISSSPAPVLPSNFILILLSIEPYFCLKWNLFYLLIINELYDLFSFSSPLILSTEIDYSGSWGPFSIMSTILFWYSCLNNHLLNFSWLGWPSFLRILILVDFPYLFDGINVFSYPYGKSS